MGIVMGMCSGWSYNLLDFTTTVVNGCCNGNVLRLELQPLAIGKLPIGRALANGASPEMVVSQPAGSRISVVDRDPLEISL